MVWRRGTECCGVTCDDGEFCGVLGCFALTARNEARGAAVMWWDGEVRNVATCHVTTASIDLGCYESFTSEGLQLWGEGLN